MPLYSRTKKAASLLPIKTKKTAIVMKGSTSGENKKNLRKFLEC